MKKTILALILGLSVLACPILYFAVGPKLDPNQLRTLEILLMIAGGSALFCFVTGELSGNNSQMDKLWSILPAVYLWVIAARGGMHLRLVLMAAIGTRWGARLTFNFARKGAYRLKFWTGNEDYRWSVVRSRKEFQPRWKWMLFDFFFISVYQNLLILTTVFPALVSMPSVRHLNWIDWTAAVLAVGFLLLETVADEQQWAFQSKKWEMLHAGKQLADLPEPYSAGFNTTGLWSRSRHPNYLGEQGVWASFYLFSVGAGVGLFNWSLIGAVLLIVLFLGSSSLAEEISRGKYPEYANYLQTVSKYFPGRRYSPAPAPEQDAAPVSR